MADHDILIIRASLKRTEVAAMAAGGFGDMVKGVVDVTRGIMALGGALHSDEESFLLDDGSRQVDLWGINLYPGETGPDWIEFDSMINVRPTQGNRSRGIDSNELQETIRRVVASLVTD